MLVCPRCGQRNIAPGPSKRPGCLTRQRQCDSVMLGRGPVFNRHVRQHLEGELNVHLVMAKLDLAHAGRIPPKQIRAKADDRRPRGRLEVAGGQLDLCGCLSTVAHDRRQDRRVVRRHRRLICRGSAQVSRGAPSVVVAQQSAQRKDHHDAMVFFRIVDVESPELVSAWAAHAMPRVGVGGRIVKRQRRHRDVSRKIVWAPPRFTQARERVALRWPCSISLIDTGASSSFSKEGPSCSRIVGF